MKAPRIVAGALVAVAALVVAAVLLHRRTALVQRDLVVTAAREATPLDNELEVAAPLEAALRDTPALASMRTESTASGVRITLALEAEARQAEELTAAEAAARDAVSRLKLPRRAAPPEVKEAPGPVGLWVFSDDDLGAPLRALAAVARVDVCGAPFEQVRVRIDDARMRAVGLDLTDLPLGDLPDDVDRLRALRIKDKAALEDIATIARGRQAPPCGAFADRGQRVIAHAVWLADGATPAALATALPPSAAVHVPEELVVARFYVARWTSRLDAQRLAADVAGEAAAKAGLRAVAVTMTRDGAGALFVRGPAEVDELRRATTASGALWGGIRGAPRLEVIVQGNRPNLEVRAADVARRVNDLEDVGPALATSPGAAASPDFEIDAQQAKRYGLEPKTLLALVRHWRGDDEDAPVRFETRSWRDALEAKPLGWVIKGREVMREPVRVKLGGAEVFELAWTNGEGAAVRRVRQALGASPEVLVRAATGDRFSAF